MSQKYIKSQNRNSHNAMSYGKYYATAVYDNRFIGTEEDGGSSAGSDAGNGGSQNSQNTPSNSENSDGFALTISTSGSGSATVTLNGNAVTSGSSLSEDDEVAISITPAEGQVPTATLNGSTIELTENDGVYTGNFAMPGEASTLVINTGAADDDGFDKD